MPDETKKQYTQLLPMKRDQRVVDQFGFLPLSVFRPEKRPDLDALVGDAGDPTGSTRRSATAKYLPGLRFSKFHPHLAEMAIRYWSLPRDMVVDPFAGRATRGVIAAHLGRTYLGLDVAPATQQLAQAALRGLTGTVWLGDGCLMKSVPDGFADLIFTCPPYHQLERYEGGENQLSHIKTYEDFLSQISVAAASCYRVLKPGKFLLWVCGDWRDGKAFRLFHADSLRLFQAAGFTAHDIVIVHNNSPFAPLQAGKVAAKRYTSKVHEYLLVFRKPEIE